MSVPDCTNFVRMVQTEWQSALNKKNRKIFKTTNSNLFKGGETWQKKHL